MTQTILVTSEQVEAAQTLVRISGGLDKVDPLIAKIAQAKPRRKDEPKS
jgi:cystathionine beta-lyase/cystathionine gamma-synthase